MDTYIYIYKSYANFPLRIYDFKIKEKLFLHYVKKGKNFKITKLKLQNFSKLLLNSNLTIILCEKIVM